MMLSWGRVSEAAAERCHPSRIMNLCHVTAPITKYPPLILTREVQGEILKELFESKWLSFISLSQNGGNLH